MMGHFNRCHYYREQTGSQSLTHKQRKRAQKKLGHALAKKNITTIRTIKRG